MTPELCRFSLLGQGEEIGDSNKPHSRRPVVIMLPLSPRPWSQTRNRWSSWSSLLSSSCWSCSLSHSSCRGLLQLVVLVNLNIVVVVIDSFVIAVRRAIRARFQKFV